MTTLISVASPTGVKIRPLDAPLGAVVTGLNAQRPIAPEVVLRLKQALLDHHILIFQQQRLTEPQLFEFAMHFGALFVPPDEVPVLASAPGITPVVIPVANTEGGYTGTGELGFHADHHWAPYPSSGSLLYAEEVPSQGGDTYWLNLHAAYEALSDATKAHIAQLRLITYNPFVRDPGTKAPRYRRDRTHLVSPVFPHPLVRTHPASGKKVLFLGIETEVELVGVDSNEGAAIIEQLRQHLVQPQFYYRHHWSVGDIVYWDNQATLHRRDAFDPQTRRVMKRVSLAGSRPF